MMNCRKAEQLIPLFVEADLDVAEMQQVSEHLETCVTCRKFAAELRASQSLLRSVALPVFDEAMLAEMRNAVLQRVDQTATRPNLAGWWQPLWNWKFAFVAAALILLVFGVAISWRSGKTVDNQVASKTRETNPAPSDVSEKNEAKLPIPTQQLQSRMGRKRKARTEVIVSERNFGNNPRRQPSLESATGVENQIATVAIVPGGPENNAVGFPRGDTLGFTLPPALQAESATAIPEKSASEPEMLRMEFQTADPNIRIIWLTPKSALAAK